MGLTNAEACAEIAGPNANTWKPLQTDLSFQYVVPYGQITALRAGGLVTTKFNHAYALTTVRLTAKGRQLARRACFP